jgi:integrase
LKKIFSADWYVNGAGKRTAKGTYYRYRPHYYWLPLLALYCGGRLNELSQLYLQDIVQSGGIHCLDFNLQGDGKLDLDEGDGADARDKSLKNVSSARVVPLPQKLINLGFLEYVEKLRALGYTRLFPELGFDAEKGYGKYAGKWFNDSFLGKQLAIPRDGTKTFHSMRHNFATALGIIQAQPNAKADLMGHSRRGATVETRYDKGDLGEKKALIDRVEHQHPEIQPFDVDKGVQAMKDALKLKTSRVGKARPASI